MKRINEIVVVEGKTDSQLLKESGSAGGYQQSGLEPVGDQHSGYFEIGRASCRERVLRLV